jgi:hypothetical protein
MGAAYGELAGWSNILPPKAMILYAVLRINSFKSPDVRLEWALPEGGAAVMLVFLS